MARQRRKKHLDLDSILAAWEFVPGQVRARIVEGGDGREVLQMRVDLGVLQLEVAGRPDGQRPGGAETYLDFLLAESMHEGERFRLTVEQCNEVDREFLQFYHRRLCWLSLREFQRAASDADHNLELMDFVRDRADDEDWVAAHEQYRPFVLFHRSYARAMAELEDQGPEMAIDELNRGLHEIRRVLADWEAADAADEEPLVAQLSDLRETLREQFKIGQTLTEQLETAIQNERYELAAELRDRIARRAQ